MKLIDWLMIVVPNEDFYPAHKELHQVTGHGKERIMLHKITFITENNVRTVCRKVCPQGGPLNTRPDCLTSSKPKGTPLNSYSGERPSMTREEFESDVYRMDHKNRGMAIIINNQRFEPHLKLSDRSGTDVDGMALHSAFKAMGFDVKLQQNKTVEEMMKILYQASKENDYHLDSDCFICAILTHGKEGVVYGTDGESNLQNLLSFFKGNACPGLVGKPKIFFIQACQGQKFDEGVGVDVADARGHMPKEISIKKIPSEADFLLAYSVVPGQHLITAVAENMYGYRTTTWYLGDKTSFIELDTPSMTTEQVSELEDGLNQKIREGIKVYPTYFEDKNDPRVEEFRTWGLPDDHVGPVRVMTIEGIDSCLCCGTHVSTTADLQLIKLLGVERGKRKNSTNLNFVVGNRVLQYLGRCLEVEKSLTALLKGPLDQHYDLAEKAVKGYKNAQKVTQTLLRDVAVLEAEKYKSNPNRDPVFVCHRKEGDIDFLHTLAREIGDQCDLCFLTAGEDKGSGFVMMTGKENLIQDLVPKLMELMDGKGGCSKGRFQGKVNKLQHRQKAEQLIRNNLGCGDNQTP